MVAQWADALVGKMNGKITRKQLARKLGLTPEWVGKVLANRVNAPAGAEEKFSKAVDELLTEFNRDDI